MADTARELSPEDDESRIRAAIARHESGPEGALLQLGDQENIDGINLRAIFLLELGRVDECQAILQGLDEKGIVPNAETFRARALCSLLRKNIKKARQEIQKALEIAPYWISNRFASGVITYFQALAPAIFPDHLVTWPLPVESDYYKTDDESHALLENALEIFQDLASQPDLTDVEIRTFQVWHLACLAIDPEKKESAINECANLLNADPTDFRLIAWATTQGYRIDLGPSKRLLKRTVHDRSASVLEIQALTSIYLAEKNSTGILHLLKQTENVFHSVNADELWFLLRLQAWAVEGNLRAAQNSLERDNYGSVELRAKAIAHWIRGRQTKDWHMFVHFLEEAYQLSGDATFLFEVCQWMGSEQKWEYIIQRSSELIAQISTSAVLTLIAIAFYNDQKPSECQKLLTEHQNWFRNGKLPGNLRRIKAFCSFDLGNWSDAVAELERLAQEEPGVGNYLALFEFYYKTGDYAGLGTLGKKLIHLDLRVEILLQLSRILQMIDLELARDYLKKAMQEIPNSLVGEALALGFQLGIEDDFADLHSRFSQLGQQGKEGIRQASLDEMIEFLKQQREQQDNLNKHYRESKIPIHILADQSRTPLAAIYHQIPTRNENNPQPLQQLPVLIRYGGRAQIQDLPDVIPAWQLHLDITALLLAQHLGILPLVERTFGSLYIPEETIPALLQMQERLKHSQPSRLKECKQITDLVIKAKLKVIETQGLPISSDFVLPEEMDEELVALYLKALETNSYVVTFLPVHSSKKNIHSLVELPEVVYERLLNCRSIVDALREQGPLSLAQYEQIITKLGTESALQGAGNVPKQNSSLYCHANIPGVLAGAEILGEICERFETYIEKRELDQVQSELSRDEQAQQLSEWIDELISHLNRGIKDGYYVSISSPRKRQTKNEIPPEDLCTQCVTTLLTYDTREGDVIWVDDRFLTSFSRRDTTPLICLEDILRALVAAKVITLDRYFETLIKARKANLRFIPIQRDEILYHLKQANVVEGLVVDTEELATLRRYYGACLLQGDILHRPPMPKGSPVDVGEVDFLLGLGHAITGVLADIWSDDSLSEVYRFAYGDWVVTNLYLDHLGMSNAIGWQRSNQDDVFLVAVSMASFFSQAFNLPSGKRSGTKSIRKQYLDWLENRILEPRFQANSEINRIVANYIMRAYQNIYEEEKEPIYVRVKQALIQEFILDLPMSLQKEIEKDENYMHQMGFNPIVKLPDLSFDANIFWIAVSEAVNGRGGIALAYIHDSEKQVAFEPVSEDIGYGFEFIHPGNQEKRVVLDDVFGFLQDTSDDLESALLRNRHWICGSEDFRRQVFNEIISIEDPLKMMEKVGEWRKSSLVVFRSDLRRELEESQAVDFDHLIPSSTEGLIRYFRFDQNIQHNIRFEDIFSAAAKSILDDDGLVEGLERFFGFPVVLPEVLIDALVQLPQGVRRQTLEQVIGNARTPLQEIHCISLILKFSGEMPEFQQIAQHLIAGLISDNGLLDVEAFLSVLRWVYEEFYNRQIIKKWPFEISLAVIWAHADWLFSTFVSVGVPPQWLSKIFVQQTQRRALLEVFDSDSPGWSDVCHPWQNDPLRFLVSGLCHSLKECDLGFVKEELQKLVLEKIIPVRNDVRLPALAMLRSPNFLQNKLNSFLYLDHLDRIIGFVSPEYAAIFSPAFLYASLDQAIRQLEEDPLNFLLWLQLYGILDGLPSDVHLAENLKRLFAQLDFADIFKKDPGLSLWAVQIAATQLRNLKAEELRLHIKNSLLEITGLLAASNLEDIHLFVAQGGKDKKDDISTLLLDSALQIAIASPSSSNIIQEFADIVFQITRAWSPCTEIAQIVTQHLYEQLLIPEAQKFLSLLLRFRAEI